MQAVLVIQIDGDNVGKKFTSAVCNEDRDNVGKKFTSPVCNVAA